MPPVPTGPPVPSGPPVLVECQSTMDQIAALGAEFNTKQYELVRLVARFEQERDWFRHGYPNAAMPIARQLDMHTSTVREWIRVGNALECLPLIDAAFAANELSYTKARILTRFADDANEEALLGLAAEQTAARLTTAILEFLDEDDPDRDRRHHEARGVTIHTNHDGMVVVRAVLPPNIGKQIAAAIDTLVKQVAATPDRDIEPATKHPDHDQPHHDSSRSASTAHTESRDPSADASTAGRATAGQTSPPRSAPEQHSRSRNASADGSAPPTGPSMGEQLRELKRRWQPAGADDEFVLLPDRQRADAFVLLFLGKNIELTTEVVIHIRGDGNTFDDGTPLTTNAITQRLDQSFIRGLIHDTERRPIDASNRRRYPTKRQARVVLEAHGHQCVDCHTADLLEFDHNPPFHQTHHTLTNELQPRCAPCHRARHRHQDNIVSRAA